MNIWDFVKIFVVLFLLVGLLYFTLILVKKYFYQAESKHPKLINIKVLASQIIMPKKFLSVVKIQEKFYILGISEHSVNLIDRFEDQDLILKLEQGNSSSMLSFLDYFKKSMGKK